MTASLLMLIPLVAAAIVPFAPARQAKWIAMIATFAAFIVSLIGAVGFEHWTDGQFGLEKSVPLAEAFGITLSMGADSVSLLLVLLTTLLMPLCVWASFTAVTERLREYYAWLLVIETAMVGVFLARDLIFFYVCFELTLVPMFFLIAIYGSDDRARASFKFFIYTFTGSLIALAGLLYVVWQAAEVNNAWSFDIAHLTHFATSTHVDEDSGRVIPNLNPMEQAWVLFALMAGFAVKVPLFPLHTWLPLAHTQAPTAGSVILAGVLLKLGTYGMYRFILPMLPGAVVEYAPFIAVLSIIGIIYAALICWVQSDVKKLVAYSSVSHLGFCVLGLFALNPMGVQGSVLYMLNHGVSTGALFLLVGMIYERYHTRDMDSLGGLARRMPVWSFFMVFFVLSSVGLPGLNGFIGEFLCLIGTFTATPDARGYPGVLGPWYAAFAASGMIFAAMYLLMMTGKIVWGPLKEPRVSGHGHGPDDHGASHHHSRLPADLTLREIGVLTPLAVVCVVIGFQPARITDALAAPIESTLALYPSQVQRAAAIARGEQASNGAPTTALAAAPRQHQELITMLTEGQAMADFVMPLLWAQARTTTVADASVSMGAKLWFIMPEIALFIGACVVVVLGLSPTRRVRDVLPWITCGFLGLGTALSAFAWGSPHGRQLLMDHPNLLLMPYLGQYVKIVVCGMGIVLTLLTVGMVDRRLEHAVEAGRVKFDPIRANRGEFHAFMLLSLTGVMLICNANDLIWLFLALELTSLPTYIMVAMSRGSRRAQEAAVKYFLGAMATAMTLYGFALLYGATGTMVLGEMQSAFGLQAATTAGVNKIGIVGMILAALGLSFKIAAAPMHFYAPDVYEGAASPVTAFLAFVPKTAGFLALMLLLTTLGWTGHSTVQDGILLEINGLPQPVMTTLWMIAVLTMTLGNIGAILQKSAKRVLAYSSIAHSGYMLLGIIAGPGLGLNAVLFYLLAYGIMNTAAFAVLVALERQGQEIESMEDLAGLRVNHPAMAAVMAIAAGSLLGVPPLLGFWGKLYLFIAAVQADQIALVVIAGLNSAISAWYYLRLIALPIMNKPTAQSETVLANPYPWPRVAGVITAALVVLLPIGVGSLVKASERTTDPVKGETRTAQGD